MTFSKFITRCLPAVALLLTAGNTKANTYTAVATGDFSSGTTWVGGIAPSANITNDVIVIPGGITVNLTQGLSVSSAASVLNVDGAMTANTGASLTITNASFTGAGYMNLDSVVVGTSQWGYTGSIYVQQLVSNGFEINSGSLVQVNKTLYLKAGLLNLTSGGVSAMPNTVLDIVVNGGTIASSGFGGLMVSNSYNVRYIGTGANSNNIDAGVELANVGLANLDIDLPGGGLKTALYSVQMSGRLTLTAGRLRLGGGSLTMEATDSTEFAPTGTGVIVGAPTSDFYLVMNHHPAGAVRFASDSNTFQNFAIQIANHDTVKVVPDVHVTGQFDMIGVLDIDTNQLILDYPWGNGGTPANYIMMRGNGRMSIINVPVGTPAMYYIGTPHHYMPAIVTPNTGNNSGMISVGVVDSVYADGGFTGVALSATQPMVNATWHVKSANTTNINLKLQLMWLNGEVPSAMVNGFTETDPAYVSHYTNGGWDSHPAIPVSVSLAGAGYPDTLSLDNITSLSPFASFSHNAVIPPPTAVPSVIVTHDVTIYPNPVTTVLQVNSAVPVTAAAIYAADGRMVKNVPVKNNTIPVADLAPGIYYLRFTASEALPVQQFTKQ